MSDLVLIVEDDRAIAELERDYLIAEGFDAEIVTTGEHALQRIGVPSAPEPVAILLDLMLPGVDGFTVARELRRRSEVPIVVVSARQEDIDKIRGFGLGVDDYVTKPFSPGELVARIKAHVARYRRLSGDADHDDAAATRGGRISVGPLTLDPGARRLTVRGEPIDLTAKEFAIIQLFLEHPDWVFTRDEIYDSVWGPDAYGDRSTVTVHVRKLREKIERDPSDPQLIRTVWGLGYRFSADSE